MDIKKPRSITCKHCGADNSPKSQFCSNCGILFKEPKPIEPDPVYCDNCGAKNKQSANYCTECGADLEDGEEPAAEATDPKQIPSGSRPMVGASLEVAASGESIESGTVDKHNAEELSDNATDSRNRSRVNSVKSAGQSAELVGWVLLLTTSGLIWLSNSDAGSIFIYWLLGMAVAFYLILSGKYIHNFVGKKIGGLLVLNGIVCLTLARGIIPLVVAVQSFIAASKYSRARKGGDIRFGKAARIDTKQKVAFVILICLNIVSIGFRVYTDDGSAQAVRSQTKSYSSPTDLFTVNYPGQPTVTAGAETVQGKSVPYNTYDSNVSNQEYTIYAYTWPVDAFNFAGLSAADTQKALKGSSDGTVEGLKGTEVKSSNSNFLGHLSYDEKFHFQNNGAQYDGYIKLFFVGNREYGLLAVGCTQDEFNTFANSFNLNGQ